MNTKLMVPVVVLALAAGGVSYGTFAFFTDEEASVQNIFTGATLDLTTDDAQGVSGSITDESMTPGDSTSGSVLLKAGGSLGAGLVLDLLVETDDDTGSSGDFEEKQELGANDAEANAELGYAIALSDDTMLVGAYRDDNKGSAYVFTTNDNGLTWSQEAKLQASDGSMDDFFGTAVAISGDTAVVGAYYDDDAGTSSGSAYVFTRSGSIWTEQQKLVASDDAAGDLFGRGVAVDGDTIAIGSPRDDDGAENTGSVYVYTSSDGGSTWTEQQKLTASDADSSDEFGTSVALSGDQLASGAYYDDAGGLSNSGSVYAFTRSGSVWTEQQKLTASDAEASDYLGIDVAMDGDKLVAGAYGSGDGGAAYVFVTSDNGASWTQKARLEGDSPQLGDNLGLAVDISGSKVVAGARRDDDAAGADQGTAYAFTSSDGGTTWSAGQKITAADAAAGDYFGEGVAIAGDIMAVGAPRTDDGGDKSGSVYAYFAPEVAPDLATYLLVTQLDYDGAGLTLPGDVDADGRSNTLADLNTNGAFTGLASPSAAGKTLAITVQLDNAAGGDVMGKTEDMTLKFLLRQTGAPSL